MRQQVDSYKSWWTPCISQYEHRKSVSAGKTHQHCLLHSLNQRTFFSRFSFAASLVGNQLWSDTTDKLHIWAALQRVIIRPIVVYPAEYITLQVHYVNVIMLFSHCSLYFALLPKPSQLVLLSCVPVCLFLRTEKEQKRTILRKQNKMWKVSQPGK